MSLKITAEDLRDFAAFYTAEAPSIGGAPHVVISEQWWADEVDYYNFSFRTKDDVDQWKHSYQAFPRPLSQYRPKDPSRGLDAPYWSGNSLVFFWRGRDFRKHHYLVNPSVSLSGRELMSFAEFIDWFDAEYWRGYPQYLQGRDVAPVASIVELYPEDGELFIRDQFNRRRQFFYDFMYQGHHPDDVLYVSRSGTFFEGP